MKKLLIITAGAIGFLGVFVYLAYPFLEAGYQRDMDVIRRKHAHQIADLIREFANKTGYLPFQEQAKDEPFMILIGHSPQHEARFANDPVLKRDGQWANASLLESMLQKELGRRVLLPRDPQTVPTYAPNVYVYFVSGNQMSVVSHLHDPHEGAVEYEWRGRPFYAYTITYDFNPSESHP